MSTTWLWRRKSDGVEVTSGSRLGFHSAHEQTLVERVDNGRRFWVSWGGLHKKYELISKEYKR